MTQLRTIDIIMQMRSDGSAPRLIVQGLLSTKAVRYCDIANRFVEKRNKRKRASVHTLIYEVAEEMKTSRATIYRALHVMEVMSILPKNV